MINSKRSGKADTAVLNNLTLSQEEKYEKLNYSSYTTVENNAMKMYQLHILLSKKYAEFKNLSERETKKLILISKKYFRKLILQ